MQAFTKRPKLDGDSLPVSIKDLVVHFPRVFTDLSNKEGLLRDHFCTWLYYLFKLKHDPSQLNPNDPNEQYKRMLAYVEASKIRILMNEISVTGKYTDPYVLHSEDDKDLLFLDKDGIMELWPSIKVGEMITYNANKTDFVTDSLRALRTNLADLPDFKKELIKEAERGLGQCFKLINILLEDLKEDLLNPNPNPKPVRKSKKKSTKTAKLILVE